MIDLRSIRILGLMVVCFACITRADAWGAPNTNDECPFPPPETWNTHEQWAWDEHLCLGTGEIDFSEHDDLNCNGGKEVKRASISPEFIKHLLTHHQANKILTENSIAKIELRCGVFDRELHLRDIRTDKEFQFDDFLFNHGFSIDENNRLGGLVIMNSTIHGNLSAMGVSFTDDIWLEDSKIHDKLNLSRAEVGGNIIINHTEIDGGLFLEYSTIKGFVSIVGPDPSSGSRTKCSLGKNKHTNNGSDGTEPVGLNLSEARLEQPVQIGRCTIHGNISTIGGPVHVRDGEFAVVGTKVYGNINLYRANINGQLRVAVSKIDGHMNLDRANIDGRLAVLRSKIDGHMNLDRATVNGELAVLNSEIKGNVNLDRAKVKSITTIPDPERPTARSEIHGDIQASGSHTEGDWDLRKLHVKGAVKLEDANVGKSLYIGDFPIKGLDLSGAEVSEELKVAKCPREYFLLRYAHLGVLKLEPENECTSTNVKPDVLGLTYDNQMLLEMIGARTAENKQETGEEDNLYEKWLLPKTEPGIAHNPQPYTQMADGLADLGYIKYAKRIRIEERKENLQHLVGWELAWQWIIGRTTHFGYEPQQALKWLGGLILAGTALLICAAVVPEVIVTRTILWAIPTKWRDWCCKAAQYTSPYTRFVGKWILPAIGVISIVWLACANKRAEDISGHVFDVLHSLMFDTKDPFSVGDTIAVLSIVALLLIVVPLLLIGWGVDFKNAAANSAVVEMQPSFDRKGAGQLCFAAFLYSIDRAVPFLSFDSEHVKWFKEGHHLNDRGLLCLYFYAHAVVGFTLISLFLAGLTGILR